MKRPIFISNLFGNTAFLSAVFFLAVAVVAFSLTMRPTEAQPAQAAQAESPAPAEEQGAPKPATASKAAAPIDLPKQPTLFVVGYAHLDTEWRWEYPQVIDEYLSKTMRTNFYLFEKYPHYIFNFTGANHFMMMKEYFPADFAKLKHYVEAGRWFPAGSSMEENDVNSPTNVGIVRMRSWELLPRRPRWQPHGWAAETIPWKGSITPGGWCWAGSFTTSWPAPPLRSPMSIPGTTT